VRRNARQDRILKLVQNLRQISVADLGERLDVSQVTIRKDLNELEEQGLILRSHGMARVAEVGMPIPPVDSRRSVQSEQKQTIADAALKLIQLNDTICIDSGSTNQLLAEKLISLPITVVTNGLEVMKTLSTSEELSLISLGGNYRTDGGSFIGPVTEDSIAQFRFDIAFVGCWGFNEKGEFFTQNLVESRTKRKILEASNRRVILADSRKIHAGGFSQFANSDLVDILITDKDFDMAEEIQQQGIEVILV